MTATMPSIKPTHLELYVLEGSIPLFSLQPGGNQNLIEFFMTNFKSELPCHIAVEVYQRSSFLKLEVVSLECKGCSLCKTQETDDLCKLCLANYVLEQIKNIF
jgi:hypothetical protein